EAAHPWRKSVSWRVRNTKAALEGRLRDLRQMRESGAAGAIPAVPKSRGERGAGKRLLSDHRRRLSPVRREINGHRRERKGAGLGPAPIATRDDYFLQLSALSLVQTSRPVYSGSVSFLPFFRSSRRYM